MDNLLPVMWLVIIRYVNVKKYMDVTWYLVDAICVVITEYVVDTRCMVDTRYVVITYYLVGACN